MFGLVCHGCGLDQRPARPLDAESTAGVNRLMTPRGIDGPGRTRWPIPAPPGPCWHPRDRGDPGDRGLAIFWLSVRREWGRTRESGHLSIYRPTARLALPRCLTHESTPSTVYSSKGRAAAVRIRKHALSIPGAVGSLSGPHGRGGHRGCSGRRRISSGASGSPLRNTASAENETSTLVAGGEPGVRDRPGVARGGPAADVRATPGCSALARQISATPEVPTSRCWRGTTTPSTQGTAGSHVFDGAERPSAVGATGRMISSPIRQSADAEDRDAQLQNET